MNHTVYMRSEKHQIMNAQLDAHSLLGQWVNLDANTKNLRQMTLEFNGNVHSVHVLAAGEQGTSDWGSVPVSLYVANGKKQVVGFHAQFHNNNQRNHISANFKMGIFIVQFYSSETGNNAGTFCKEYFLRANSPGGKHA